MIDTIKGITVFFQKIIQERREKKILIKQIFIKRREKKIVVVVFAIAIVFISRSNNNIVNF